MGTVVLIARHYWPKPGAATVRLEGLVAELRQRDVDVVVLTASSPELRVRTTGALGETIVPLAGDRSTGVSASRAIALVKFALLSLIASLRVRDVSAIIVDPPPTNGVVAAIIGKLRRVPVYYYLADSWADMVESGKGGIIGVVGALVRFAERLAFRHSTAVIAVTPRLASSAEQHGARDVLLAVNGADLSAFSPEGSVWDDPWQGEIPYFLYAGNYGFVHGASVFARAAADLWDAGERFGIVFMGYGAEEEAIQEYATRFPTRLRMLEPQPPEVAAGAFRGAKGALCSVSSLAVTADAVPAKALAALACGCPLVYSGRGDFSQVVSRNQLGVVSDWEVEETRALLLRALELDRSPMSISRLSAFAGEHFDRRRSALRIVELMGHA